MKFLHKIITLLALFALLLSVAPSQPAYAASFSVGTAAELIAAINTANGNGEADTITLTANITLNSTNYANDLTEGVNGLPSITSIITIEGDGYTIERESSYACTITHNASQDFRILHINSSGNLTLNNLTIKNGCANNTALFRGYHGGGIRNVNGGTLAITNSTLSGNKASNSTESHGGGISNEGTLTVSNSIFSKNISYATAAGGGGVSNFSTGTLTVSNSTFSENISDASLGLLGIGGGIHSAGVLIVSNSTFFGNIAHGIDSGLGAGIFTENPTASTTVTNSTFSGNTASGGDVSIGGGIAAANMLTVTNSTFSGNTASTSSTFSYGGGIVATGTLTVTNSTFSGNAATTGGGIFLADNVATLKNTIIANSISGGDCAILEGGTITATTNNLDTDGSCDNATTSTTIGLGALADNGGPTMTMAIETGSAAYNAGNNATCESIDQRGVARPQNTTCDIGAYELDNWTSPTVTIEQGSTQSDPTNISPIVFDVIFSENVTGFDNTDVNIAGMAGVATITVTSIGTGDTYTVEVEGMVDGETVTATIPADAAQDVAGNNNTDSTSIDNSVTYTISSPIVTNTSLLTDYSPSGPSSFTVTFSKDVFDPTGNTDPDDVTNPANYLLVEDGIDNIFNTINCAGGEQTDDTKFTVNTVTYNSSTFTSTVNINNGIDLPAGTYRLFVCGTTSIVDLAGNPINGGTDAVYNFTVTAAPSSLPSTGFRHGSVTALPKQPTAKAYTETAMMLEIPKLSVSMPIVGVPQSESGWDVNWLGNSAGYLAGSAFPTWVGNTVITGHVWDAFNRPGVFAEVKSLKYGDQVEIHAWGQVYTYEVRESKLVTTKNVSAVLQSEEYDWVTLVTCEFYNPFSGDYLFRRAVRAVLVSVR